MAEKLCTRCKIKQDINNFSLNSASRDGHVTICKSCKNLEYRQKHPNKKYVTSFEKNNREVNGVKEKCCTSCKEWKTLDNFYNNAKTLDGLCTSCISCDRLRKQKNREHILEYSRKYNAEHKDEKLKYRQEHKEQARQYKLAYDNIPENKERKRLWSIEYRNKTKKQIKQYYLEHRDELLDKEKIRRLQNSDVYKERDRQRYKNNKLSRCFSVSLRNALGDNKSGQHWETLVPYTLQDLRQHLESQFTPEMSWDNYGSYWEIDHIIPQNLFNIQFVEDEQFRICWSLKNLRPLEKSLNRRRPKDGRDVSKEQAITILGQDLYYDIMDAENKESFKNV